MIGYLGAPGAMVALPYRGGLSTSTDRPASFVRTLGGKRKAFVGARSRREWSVSFDLIGSEDTHGLVQIAQFGGPVFWYPADASGGNLLSPQATGWTPTPAGATDAGLVSLPDGTVARAVAHGGVMVVGVAHGGHELVQVEPGEAVSLGVWARNGARLSGWWRDLNGATLTSFASVTSSFSGWAWRQATFTPPAGAAYLSMHVSAGSMYARPAVSRGAEAIDRPGRGCPKAVVHGLSESLAVIAQDDAYGSIDVTITEVG